MHLLQTSGGNFYPGWVTDGFGRRNGNHQYAVGQVDLNSLRINAARKTDRPEKFAGGSLHQSARSARMGFINDSAYTDLGLPGNNLQILGFDSRKVDLNYELPIGIYDVRGRTEISAFLAFFALDAGNLETSSDLTEPEDDHFEFCALD